MGCGIYLRSSQYNTGNGMIIPITTDPLHFSRSAELITFPASVSHPHMALQHDSEVIIPDLVRRAYLRFFVV